MRFVARLVFIVTAMVALLLGAVPVAATGGADFGQCVAQHATTEGGFTREHNPGMHQGFAGWSGCLHD